jgi:hypothetical protein
LTFEDFVAQAIGVELPFKVPQPNVNKGNRTMGIAQPNTFAAPMRPDFDEVWAGSVCLSGIQPTSTWSSNQRYMQPWVVFAAM